ncbi:MAG: alpha-E domain-containing protein [Hyphomicrobiaceae bacterium]|nr:alpha-E domain-containing protein [Hyphomicrobiaceae bacterium]
MLGRTAHDLYWLSRYIERAENMARLMDVGYRIGLIPRSAGRHQEWHSTLKSTGCAKGYYEKHEKLDARAVVNYLLVDQDNPSSVRSCLAAARNNGRAQRTAITSDMWESLNQTYLEFSRLNPAGIRLSELPDILLWVKQRSALFRGTLLNTLLRRDGFYFSQLGTFIERADNTARIIDVKYYLLLPQNEIVGGGIDNYQWSAILRSVSAHRSYKWTYQESYKPWRIAEYIILNPEMPRSLRFCSNEISEALESLAHDYGGRHACHRVAEDLKRPLAATTITPIFQTGLHEFLVEFLGRNNQLGSEIAEAYHFVS